ncbi:elongation factor P 5-aminopentanone reductase [Staphylococcus simulans]|uniref:elongation factor P 5-aminopentanone reductase n=1 Tax=Staphylococcus simulans TaxID=1286 RepID=UPI000D0370D5|nr:SDR family NAD(P)-dependent oxidoreductase [Staphylococcus simulans]AVO02380.1 3-oxoacyl-ACP reductase [Staphylococcus simulans]AVO05326.1 3-oxoacyl-ACP reductase [Staphylococcus simulans]AWG18928.1 3-oxoacyl-ACP reductase [Staphylococcus simulans]AWI01876.1 3-oxoacyl-ACP reductase [Staphylococcus simulans]MCE5024592.1 SDR family NAD(P)-dependent oxidoreductase [Staphylococcus simulans]
MKALVIGGSGSIGSAIVEQLLSDGYEVIVHYNQSSPDQLKAKYESQNVSFVQADLTQNINMESVFSFIHNLDVLVYAAGRSLYGMFQDMTATDIDACYQLNVKNMMLIPRFFLEQLRASAHGRILIISSIWGETGASMETVYSAMKAAQIGFVKALSQELAMTNITVNAVTPGMVSGNMADEFEPSELAAIIDELPQQRMVTPDEVAYTCAYLYDKRAQSVTGTIQKVNGGWYI